MILRGFSTVLLVVALFTSSSAWSQAQSPEKPPENQAPYTFRAESHVVLTDVTVTDGKGNPVHGLPRSAFQIFDNNKPQNISSFEEHTGAPAAALPAEPTAHGVYSNDYLLHLPPVLNIVVIDIANLGLPEQMYLNYELTKFLKDRTDEQPLAIYLRAGNGCFLVQNFTSDKKMLLAALHKAIPRFPPLGREYLSDFDTLQQIAISLGQLPGRKNVLWFSGGSTLFLRPDAEIFENAAAWRNLYDELEQERIAVYPIDARGLTAATSRAMIYQHFSMNEVAQATGGQAFYNNNGLKEISDHLMGADGSFYTLTYSPNNFRLDNKWHKVKVKVDGGAYQVSYRSGYFADGSKASQEQTGKPRTRLMADGSKLEMPDDRSRPIVFQANVMAASDPELVKLPQASVFLPGSEPKKKTVPLAVRYVLPMNALIMRNVNGKQTLVLGVMAIVLNRDGRATDHRIEKVTLGVNMESLKRNPGLPLVLQQYLNVAKEDQYLYLGVWDMTSGRFGTLQVPLAVPKRGSR